MTDFPHLFQYTLTSDIPTLLYTWRLKIYPFRAEPPRIGHYREYLPGISSTQNGSIPHPFPDFSEL